MLPGTANTSRPCSRAQLTVIIAPDFFAPSTSSVPWDSPLMMRFRAGKLRGRGWVPGMYSEITAPPLSNICAIRPSFSGG